MMRSKWPSTIPKIAENILYFIFYIPLHYQYQLQLFSCLITCLSLSLTNISNIIRIFHFDWDVAVWIKPSVIRQKGESQKGCFKKTKHAKFSEKGKFLNPWYVHVRQKLYIKNYNKRVIEMHYCEEMGSSKIVLSSEPFAILFGRPLHVQSQQQKHYSKVWDMFAANNNNYC